jgi:hypothetical protein
VAVDDLDLAPLGRELDLLGPPAERLPVGDDLVGEAVEEVVGMKWIVVEQQQPIGADATAESERVRERAMTPTEVV